jgi:hypothetical protein
LAKRDNEELLAAEKRRQESEGQRKIQPKQEEQMSKSRINRQRELRGKYGKTAAAASAVIANEVRAAFDAGQGMAKHHCLVGVPRGAYVALDS